MFHRKYLILLSMIGLLISADQFTKTLVLSRFQLGESIPVIPDYFNLTLVHNPGAAFGFLASLDANYREPFFFAVPILTLIAIMFVFYQLKENQLLNVYSLSMIVGGALGNLIDRARLGYVVDFLDFHWHHKEHFPAFNVADSAITVGVGLLLWAMLTENKPRKT